MTTRKLSLLSLNLFIAGAGVLVPSRVTAGERQPIYLDQLRLRETRWSELKRKYMWWGAAGVATAGVVTGYFVAQKAKEEEQRRRDEEEKRDREDKRDRGERRRHSDPPPQSSSHNTTVVHNHYYGSRDYYPRYGWSWWDYPRISIAVGGVPSRYQSVRRNLNNLQLNPGLDKPRMVRGRDEEIIFQDSGGNDIDRLNFNGVNRALQGDKFITCKKHPLNDSIFLATNKGVGLVGLAPFFRERRLISQVNIENKEFTSRDTIKWDPDTEYVEFGGVEVAIDPPSSQEVNQRRKSKTFWRKVKVATAATTCFGLGALASYSLWSSGR